MTPETKKKIAVVGVGIAVIGLLLWHAKSAKSVSSDNGDTDTGGYSPSFNSNINIQTGDSRYLGLSKDYMPMFGYIAVGDLRSLPTSIQTTAYSLTTIPGIAQIPLVVSMSTQA